MRTFICHRPVQWRGVLKGYCADGLRDEMRQNMESINDVGCGRRLIADIAATTALPLAFVHAIEFVNTTKRNSNVRQFTGVNPAGDARDTSPDFLVGGTSTGISPPILLRTFGYSRTILVALRSASSRFHSAIRRHKFASVRQADSRLTRLVPHTTLNSR